eukprot:3522775-Amphidinium_carterae.1
MPIVSRVLFGRIGILGVEQHTAAKQKFLSRARKLDGECDAKKQRKVDPRRVILLMGDGTE